MKVHYIIQLIHRANKVYWFNVNLCLFIYWWKIILFIDQSLYESFENVQNDSFTVGQVKVVVVDEVSLDSNNLSVHGYFDQTQDEVDSQHELVDGSSTASASANQALQEGSEAFSPQNNSMNVDEDNASDANDSSQTAHSSEIVAGNSGNETERMPLIERSQTQQRRTSIFKDLIPLDPISEGHEENEKENMHWSSDSE